MGRILRANIVYVKLIVVMAISSLFTKKKSENFIDIDYFMISVTLSGLAAFPLSILRKLMKSKSSIVKCISIMFTIFIYIFSWYVIFISAAISGLEASNKWALVFMFTQLFDWIVTEAFVNIVKIHFSYKLLIFRCS